jgi:dihydroorotate dehydrogenase electron transfer subunit
MQPSYSKNRVVENICVIDNIYKLTVSCSGNVNTNSNNIDSDIDIDSNSNSSSTSTSNNSNCSSDKSNASSDQASTFDVKPGQFYNLRAWDREPLLSRPISIYDANETTISFLYEIRGVGTKLIAKLKKDDEIELLGPLGNSFELDKIKGRVAMVAGGIGVAPFLYTVKSLAATRMKEKETNEPELHIDLYAGFREKSYAVEEFKDYVDHIYIATDFGTEGHKGFVTDLIDVEKYDLVLSCGPEIMMGKVVNMCKAKDVEVLISMESHMACGIGACLVCACKTVDGMKRSCKDGPIFNGRDVIINE